jgi:hypothetical protein
MAGAEIEPGARQRCFASLCFELGEVDEKLGELELAELKAEWRKKISCNIDGNHVAKSFRHSRKWFRFYQVASPFMDELETGVSSGAWRSTTSIWPSGGMKSRGVVAWGAAVSCPLQRLGDVFCMEDGMERNTRPVQATILAVLLVGIVAVLPQARFIAPVQAEEVKAATGAPFTALQFRKLIRYWDDPSPKRHVFLRPGHAKQLGITGQDKTIYASKISGRDANKVAHLFMRLDNGGGYVMTREPSDTEGHFYWIDPDFKLIAAIATTKYGMVALSIVTAEQELKEEFALWATVADKLP